MEYTVGQVAEIAGVSVRALHHYDEIGLVRPARRSRAGYRLYDEADLERLFTALAYREVGLPLESVAGLLDGSTPPGAHLREQRRVLKEKLRRLERMLAAVDTMLEAEEMTEGLTPEEKFELFGDWSASEQEYAAEAEARWGDTDAWRTSQRRISALTAEDWEEIRSDTAALEDRIASAVGAGVDPEGELGTALAEEHRSLLSRWFYQVSAEMHVGLATMYTDDPRFTAYYDANVAPGAASWLRAAIEANAARAE